MSRATQDKTEPTMMAPISQLRYSLRNVWSSPIPARWRALVTRLNSDALFIRSQYLGSKVNDVPFYGSPAVGPARLQAGGESGTTNNPLTFRDIGIACGHYHH